MNEKTRKKIVYGVFIVACVWGCYNFLWTSADKVNNALELGPAVADLAASLDDATTIKLDSVADIKWGGDPFYDRARRPQNAGRTTSKSTPDSARWRLQAVLYDSQNPCAYINSQMVKVGDSVAGAKVKQITVNSVTLEAADGQHILRVAGR